MDVRRRSAGSAARTASGRGHRRGPHRRARAAVRRSAPCCSPERRARARPAGASRDADRRVAAQQSGRLLLALRGRRRPHRRRDAARHAADRRGRPRRAPGGPRRVLRPPADRPGRRTVDGTALGAVADVLAPAGAGPARRARPRPAPRCSSRSSRRSSRRSTSPRGALVIDPPAGLLDLGDRAPRAASSGPRRCASTSSRSSPSTSRRCTSRWSARRADAGLLDVHVHDLRDWTHDRHRTVDDTPYGGGPGMVMKPEPWGEALDAVLAPAGPAARGRVLVVPDPERPPVHPGAGRGARRRGRGWSSRAAATRASTAG